MNDCPICKKTTEFSHSYDSANSIFAEKKINKCYECEYFFCSEISADLLNSYYETDYDENDFNRSKKFPSPKEYFDNPNNQFKPDRSSVHINSSAKYLSRTTSLSILDCGAGLGTTLNIAKQAFPDAKLYSFENDILSKKYLDEIDVVNFSGDLLNFLKKNSIKFDLIICSHFLEHVSPNIFLEIKDMLLYSLSSDGILMIEVPNDNWFKYPHKIHAIPPHVSFFSVKSLKRIFTNEKILLIGTLWGTSRKKINFLTEIFDKVSRKISKFIYRAPFVRDGDAIFALVKKHKT